MEGISSGFQTSTVEVVIFLVLLGAIVLGILVAQILRKRAAVREQKRRAASPKKPILRTYAQTTRQEPSLSSRERATLDRLAWLLKDPTKSERLLQDDSLVLKVARQGIREGVVSEMEVMRLLRRLQVDVTPLKQKDTASTAVVPTGAEVSISNAEMAMGTGTLLLSTDASLQLRIDKGASGFKAGDPVDVVCYSNEGMHQFHTVVISVNSKNVNVRHSDHVRFAQRRKYRRREIAMPVQITMPGIGTKPLSSSTEDLSIGGAALKNPRKKLAVGAYLECAIETGAAAPLVVHGTVVRLSRRRKVAHVAFSGMDERTRHRLFRRLIRVG